MSKSPRSMKFTDVLRDEANFWPMQEGRRDISGMLLAAARRIDTLAAAIKEHVEDKDGVMNWDATDERMTAQKRLAKVRKFNK